MAVVSHVTPRDRSIVNDSYRLDICLLYPPHIIALAAVYLACTYMGRDVTDWFEALNVNREELNDVVQQLLAMYASDSLKSQQDEVKRLRG